MTRRWAAPRGRTIAVLLVALPLFAAACSGDDDAAGTAAGRDSTRTTQRPGTTTTLDPAEAMKAEVKAAYEASSRAFIEAAGIPDPNFPALAATHTGPMLDQRRGVLSALKADGRVVRYPTPSQYRIDVESVEIEGDLATLEVCIIDDGERVVVATGEVVAGGLGTAKARAAMRRIGGLWKLAERVQEAEWEGVAGCAAD